MHLPFPMPTFGYRVDMCDTESIVLIDRTQVNPQAVTTFWKGSTAVDTARAIVEARKSAHNGLPRLGNITFDTRSFKVTSCGVFPSLGTPPRKASRLEMDERE